MDEYKELAQAAVIALQAANQPTWTDVAGVVVAGLVGLGQYALIAWGIQIMKGSNDRREASMKAQHERHEATMTVLQTQHHETMAALQAQGQVLAEIGAGIREVLEHPADPQSRRAGERSAT